MKFALTIHNSKSVFEIQPDIETINYTLAVLTERTVDSGHCIKFKKKDYKLIITKEQKASLSKRLPENFYLVQMMQYTNWMKFPLMNIIPRTLKLTPQTKYQESEIFLIQNILGGVKLSLNLECIL